jgi:hypothetical protein
MALRLWIFSMQFPLDGKKTMVSFRLGSIIRRGISYNRKETHGSIELAHATDGSMRGKQETHLVKTIKVKYSRNNRSFSSFGNPQRKNHTS